MITYADSRAMNTRLEDLTALIDRSEWIDVVAMGVEALLFLEGLEPERPEERQAEAIGREAICAALRLGCGKVGLLDDLEVDRV